MKNVLLSSLVVVSLLCSANMFAMQGGDASKVQALIAKGTTEQTLAAFAKVPGKLKDKLGISDADYKAYLAQKGGAIAPAGGGGAPAPVVPGPAAVTTSAAQAEFIDLKGSADAALAAGSRISLEPIHERILTFWAKSEVQNDKDLEAKVHDLESKVQARLLELAPTPSVFTPSTTTTQEPAAPTSPRVQPDKERQIYEQILDYAKTRKNKAEADKFLDFINESVENMRNSLSW